MAANPLTPEENKDLADWALAMALTKARTLSTVETMLSGAIARIDGYMRAWNAFAKDPQLLQVRVDINELLNKLPDGAHYQDLITEALGYSVPEQFDYASPGEDRMALMRDRGADPNDDQVWEDYDLPFEDPLEVFKRKKVP